MCKIMKASAKLASMLAQLCLVLAVVATQHKLADAYPMYWYNSMDWIGTELPGDTDCDAHPLEAIPEDNAVTPHGSPEPDRFIFASHARFLEYFIPEQNCLRCCGIAQLPFRRTLVGLGCRYSNSFPPAAACERGIPLPVAAP